MKERGSTKTGTFGEVNALSGYANAASGRMVAFSMPGQWPISRRHGLEAEAIGRVAKAIAAAESASPVLPCWLKSSQFFFYFIQSMFR